MFFLNPALLYSFVWMAVLTAYQLKLSDLLIPLSFWTTFLLVGSSVTFILGWIIESMLCKWRLALPRFNFVGFSAIMESPTVARRLNFGWLALILCISFEVLYFGGAPGLGVIGLGPAIVYTDFGIPGFHGLVNSIFYACCTMQLLKIITNKSRRSYVVLLTVSLLYPFLGMSRQVLVSLLIQYLIIYISLSGLKFNKLYKIVFLAFGVALIFGWSGDVRSGRDHIIALAAPSFSYPEWLPSAFIWIYIYITSPLGNLNHNIDTPQNFFPFETVGSLFPSFLRERVRSLGEPSDDWSLVSEAFNVSSLLQSFLIDFGVAGTLFLTFVFGIFFSGVLRRAENSIAAYFSLIVILHGLTLSFFANLLIHLVFIFQVIVVSIICRRVS